MANANPPKRAQAMTFRISLEDASAPGRNKLTPTLAAADFNIDKDGGGYNPLGTTPTVSPAASRSVLITLSGTEMTADMVTLVCSDATDPPEWCDLTICILTTP